MSLRKITKNRRLCPRDDALLELFYLVLRKRQPEMDDANSGLEGANSSYHPVRRLDDIALISTLSAQNFGHPAIRIMPGRTCAVPIKQFVFMES